MRTFLTLLSLHQIHGAYRDDGVTYIGFDYIDQTWIDTSPACYRDRQSYLGSARNPLAVFPSRVYADLQSVE